MSSIAPAQTVRPSIVPILLTISEVAESLRLSKRTVELLLASNQIPSISIGRSRRVRKTDLETFASYGTAEIVKSGLRAIAESTDVE